MSWWLSSLASNHRLSHQWVRVPQVAMLRTSPNMTLAVEWDIKTPTLTLTKHRNLISVTPLLGLNQCQFFFSESLLTWNSCLSRIFFSDLFFVCICLLLFHSVGLLVLHFANQIPESH